jgi:hypothetical protein
MSHSFPECHMYRATRLVLSHMDSGQQVQFIGRAIIVFASDEAQLITPWKMREALWS